MRDAVRRKTNTFGYVQDVCGAPRWAQSHDNGERPRPNLQADGGCSWYGVYGNSDARFRRGLGTQEEVMLTRFDRNQTHPGANQGRT